MIDFKYEVNETNGVYQVLLNCDKCDAVFIQKDSAILWALTKIKSDFNQHHLEKHDRVKLLVIPKIKFVDKNPGYRGWIVCPKCDKRIEAQGSERIALVKMIVGLYFDHMVQEHDYR